MKVIDKSKSSVFFALTTLCVFGLSSMQNAFAVPDYSAQIVPHKALYSIEMISRKAGAQVANIHGDLTYEWTPSCDAWVSHHKFIMTYEYFEAPSSVVISDYSSYETMDAKSYNFISQKKSSGQIIEEVRGAVQLEDKKVSQAKFTQPEGLTFDLPKGTVFPMAHTMGVLDNMKKGEKFYKATLFDGGDTEGPVEVNTFIGKAYDMPKYIKNFKDSKEIKDADKELLASPAHLVQLAFFPQEEGDTPSDYEMSAIFHENGIISDMTINYQDFSIRQKLIGLERLKSSCDPQQPAEQEKKK